MNISRVAIDLAKNIFQVCIVDKKNKITLNQSFSRTKFITFMRKLPPSEVYMEACYSAHYWGRAFNEMGHNCHLIPAQHVTPFVRGNKSDHNDAVAIAEAAIRPFLRFVPVKTIAQQEVLALHRIRQRLVKNRTQLTNQARGLLSDFGIVFPKGFKGFKLGIMEASELESLSTIFRQSLMGLLEEFNQLTNKIKSIEKQLAEYNLSSPDCQIAESLPGIGILNASALIASIDKGQAFNNAKEIGVWLGLTPRSYSSGESFKSGKITKRGDRYLRTLLIHGARAAIRFSKNKQDNLSLWMASLVKRIGMNKAAVAVAHKLARLLWILLQKQEKYSPQHGH